MYEEMGCYESNAATAGPTAESGVSQAVEQPQPPTQQTVVTGSTTNSNCSAEVEDLSEFHLSPQDTVPAVSENVVQLQFHNQVHANAPHDHQIQMVQDLSGSGYVPLQQYVQSNWEGGCQDFVNVGPGSTTTTTDLLSLLHLPRCSVPPSMLPNSSLSFANSSLSDIMGASSVAYDPLFHLNFPLQPPFSRDQSQLLGVDDQIDADGGVMYAGGNNHGEFDNGILEFNTDIVNRKGQGSGKKKPFPTERERRIHFKDRFLELKHLLPSPTKGDRASIVADAIEYIKELLGTIEEFKLLVEKKRFGKHWSKRARIEEDSENKPLSDVDQSSFNHNNSLRCSWLRRRSKVTEVDVRIIDDEVIIKLVQKKKINCLLMVSKVLDQLQLDLHHVAGGQIGEHYSFLFNTKIYEGSSVYASAIADTLMEVVEQQYMSAFPTDGF
ncbi:PREDICTED: transcription factor bHLH10 [Tarenaya hassleriana]|uniref:transcription factor bHLH10 n=1 Tax=Tarenaya hassleriana TaxID=28532 RepID=UPI00053C7AAC|nr:PREDICTED: transcription factor bHLH10 [Tarenaya hassleriana]XP_019056512.1 PREDICTED: transcription factor bHLH10 [Tarenaya hassleriana]